MTRRDELEESLGRDTGPARKEPMKMELAQLCYPSQIQERRLLLVMHVDVADDFLDSFVVVHANMLAEESARNHPILAVKQKAPRRFSQRTFPEKSAGL